mmetsp:Transcript_8919/g.13717  ORF Transcript_8919/g.13717 Transcript_8919/m.13717 type:complete len:384 (-) Transcript_8919:107-1258(-)
MFMKNSKMKLPLAIIPILPPLFIPLAKKRVKCGLCCDGVARANLSTTTLSKWSKKPRSVERKLNLTTFIVIPRKPSDVTWPCTWRNFHKCTVDTPRMVSHFFFSKPAKMNVDALDAVTTLMGIIKFHWFYMMHDFGDRLRHQKADREGFHRFECAIVMDLSGLSVTQLGSRTLAVVKEQSFIDSLCFPETMNCMVLLNAPSFFSATWSIIKGFIDARTAGKVDVISSRKKGEKRLLEIADAEQLPSDYFGTGPSTEETLQAASPGDMKRLTSEMMYVRGSGSYKTEVEEGEEVEVFIWTRSSYGGKFSIVDQDKASTKVYAPEVEVKHVKLTEDMSENPTSKSLTPTGRIVGPASIKVKADSNGGRFASEKFLVQVCVYDKST